MRNHFSEIGGRFQHSKEERKGEIKTNRLFCLIVTRSVGPGYSESDWRSSSLELTQLTDRPILSPGPGPALSQPLRRLLQHYTILEKAGLGLG